MGLGDESSVRKLELLMNQANVSTANRPVAAAALRRADETGAPAAAIELPDGTIVTGKTTALLGSSAAALLTALKTLAGLPHDLHVLPQLIIEPIQKLKIEGLGNHNPRLHTDEVLIALSISAATNPVAELALAQLPRLSGCEVHSSVMLAQVDTALPDQKALSQVNPGASRFFAARLFLSQKFNFYPLSPCIPHRIML